MAGKSATTATIYNRGVAVANRDSALDIQGKQPVLQAMTSKDEVAAERDTPDRDG